VIAYVDSSVLLRVVLGQPDVLSEWPRVQRGVTSALTRVESLRTLDRLRLRAPLTDVEVAKRRSSILRLLDSIEIVELDPVVLERASQPMPTELGTLDAIHLASCLLWREDRKAEIVMATHDSALAIAAQSHGLTVVGA
jgi:predicted nucleic acid-binding protein